MLALYNYAGFVWFESPETTKNVIDFYLFFVLGWGCEKYCICIYR